MRLGLEIKLSEGGQSELMRLSMGLKRPEALTKAVARQAANLLRRHYRAVDARRPNRLGGPRQHWWARVASSVQNPVLRSPGEAVVAVTAPGIALRAKGGTVRPVQAAALAIPIDRESYGVWARDWEAGHPGRPLFQIRSPRGTFLAARVGDSRRAAARREGAQSQVRERPRIKVLYVLKRSAKIGRDPDALPHGEDFEGRLLDFARQWVETLRSRPS